ncbi:MAG TPA: hypothetical protein VMU89_00630 [Thermomicrobiaceae bacterium]|nr:hypothetical protein [Thermomicrobiaceae bacterium]
MARLLLLAGGACLLIALGLLPTFAFPSDLAQPPAPIVNDTASAVLFAHCLPPAPPPAAAPSAQGASCGRGVPARAGPCGADRRRARLPHRDQRRPATGALAGEALPGLSGDRLSV